MLVLEVNLPRTNVQQQGFPSKLTETLPRVVGSGRDSADAVTSDKNCPYTLASPLMAIPEPLFAADVHALAVNVGGGGGGGRELQAGRHSRNS